MSGAEIAVHPSGKFVYSSTRGANLIDGLRHRRRQRHAHAGRAHSLGRQDAAQLRHRSDGRVSPRRHQDSDNIAVFRIDAKTGKLTPTGDALEAGSPVCVTFRPGA